MENLLLGLVSVLTLMEFIVLMVLMGIVKRQDVKKIKKEIEDVKNEI